MSETLGTLIRPTGGGQRTLSGGNTTLGLARSYAEGLMIVLGVRLKSRAPNTFLFYNIHRMTSQNIKGVIR